MAVTITGVLRGNKKVEVTHGPSGFSMLTAAPKDNKGDGSSFSPTDLVATALGSCMLTTVQIWADQHELNLEGSEMTVTKHMLDNPRRIGKLPVTLNFPERLTPLEREKIERVALSCPVHRSLSPDVEIEVEFVYDR